jgi:hypothetical protein
MIPAANGVEIAPEPEGWIVRVQGEPVATFMRTQDAVSYAVALTSDDTPEERRRILVRLQS